MFVLNVESIRAKNVPKDHSRNAQIKIVMKRFVEITSTVKIMAAGRRAKDNRYGQTIIQMICIALKG